MTIKIYKLSGPVYVNPNGQDLPEKQSQHEETAFILADADTRNILLALPPTFGGHQIPTGIIPAEGFSQCVDPSAVEYYNNYFFQFSPSDESSSGSFFVEANDLYNHDGTVSGFRATFSFYAVIANDDRGLLVKLKESA